MRGFALRWPFRRKLNLLVGVPLTVVALLLAYLIADQTAQSRNAADAARLVRESAQVATLVDRLAAEHQQAVLLSVRHEAAEGGTPSAAAYRAAQSAVEAQVERVRAAFGDRLPRTEAQALRGIEGLSSLRDTVEQGYLPADNIDPAYTHAADALIDGLGLDRNPDLATTFTGSMLDSLLRAGAAHSAFETGVFSATTGDSNALIEFIGAIGSYDEYTHQTERFDRFATEAQAEELTGIKYTTPQATISRQYAELQIDPGALQSESPAEIRGSLREALESYPSYREQAKLRLAITTSLIHQIADRAERASDKASWRAIVLLGVALLGFAVWLVLAMLVRRSVVRPVQALTRAARQVADVADRELARVADDDAEESGPPKLQAMPVTARDEIGDLAEAFNHVQNNAAALLERQVLSRRNVAEMFGNVGRRVSNLTTRQLALIDAVERRETDPAMLERLYSIDHIAVRLRRNADSLMLLAGIHEADLDAEPTALTHVVRAGLGQIEGYQRVELRGRTEAMVEPAVIGDLTLMVAELVENAVSFSPEGSPVEVTVSDGDGTGGAVIVVTDHGLGMTSDRLAEENARLIRRERLDLVPTKLLGLFVVGTLARRWDIGVVLSRTPGGGLTAEVTLPPAVSVRSCGSAAGKAGASGDVDAMASGGAGSSGDVDAVHSGAAGAVTSRDSRAGATVAVLGGSGPETADGTSAAIGPGADGPRPLPRRVGRRSAPEETASSEAPLPDGGPAPSPDHARADDPDDPDQPAPSPRTHDSERAGETPGPGSTRTLRRRVRGATLRAAGDPSVQQAASRQPARIVDAEAVRAELDAFEAAVERAHRDSGPGPAPVTTPHTQDQNHLPEGAEQ